MRLSAKKVFHFNARNIETHARCDQKFYKNTIRRNYIEPNAKLPYRATIITLIKAHTSVYKWNTKSWGYRKCVKQHNEITCTMLVKWDYVCELWPQMDLLFILQILYEHGEPRRNDIDSGRPRVMEENLSQCHVVHQKSHMDPHGHEPGPPGWQAIRPTASAISRSNVNI
jgi:hypothetical protein